MSDTHSLLPEKLSIRDYVESDAQQLCAVFDAAVATIGPAHYSSEQVRVWRENAPTLNDVIRRCADGRATRVATDEHNNVLAYIDLESDGHIDHLYCSPRASKSGTAHALYESIEQLARSRCTPRLYTEASEAAQRFFARRGFVTLRRRTLIRSGVEIHNYAMEKRL